MHKLQAEDIACTEIELTGIGSKELNAQQWYGGIIQELISGFGLRVNRRCWLREHDDLSPVQCLGEFIEKVLLKEISNHIVIFIDEIDNVLALNFSTDDFFALLRTCYNKRATKPEYRRLTFALLGVATPSDLIQDKNRTPFNIGRAIMLNGFQLHETDRLADGLREKVSNPQNVIKQVLYWTDGQPFLTQKLCDLIVKSIAEKLTNGEAQWVEQLVCERLIENWEAADEPEHLRTIRNRLLGDAQSSGRYLRLYQKILLHGEIAAQNCREHIELRLSGLVVRQDGKLRVYNRIYQSVFNRSWVNRKLKDLSSDSPTFSGRTVLLISMVITILVMGLRQLKMLQPLELQAYDRLMQTQPQPTEKEDNRLLIVEVTEREYENYGFPIPDIILVKALKKLEQGQSRAIGLDIFRDLPQPPGYKDLVAHLHENKRLVGICTIGDVSTSPIAPPPAIQEKERLGFADLQTDKQPNNNDYTIRRYILSVGKSSVPCATPYSFSFLLAFKYLAAEGIEIKPTKQKDWQFGKLVIKRLDSYAGGYQQLDARGNQLLIDYRRFFPDIATKVTLTDVLNDQVGFDLVRNRVVIIGTTASSTNADEKDTPLGKKPGVYIHAHLVSQLISAALGERHLLWWWPQWGDTLWVWIWSLTGGVVAWSLRSSPGRLWLAMSISIAVLYLFCWFFLTQDGWVPLVPSALTLVTTAVGVVAYTAFQKRQQ